MSVANVERDVARSTHTIFFSHSISDLTPLPSRRWVSTLEATDATARSKESKRMVSTSMFSVDIVASFNFHELLAKLEENSPVSCPYAKSCRQRSELRGVFSCD